jgi:MYXO-CTERM domain-containing protein
VAVLDTGANSSHPDLSSSILATQRCFTQWACPPDNSAEGSSAEDDHGHGSHVSGIITSEGAVAGMGFAPDAEIVAVKINDRYDAGMVSDWVAGLDWVFSNLSTLDVKVVNMSICTNQLYGSQSACDAGEPALASAVENLVNAGVTVFAASGNKGSSTEMAAPACNSGVIAVGATYKSEQGRQPSSGTYAGRFGSSFGDCADATTEFDQIACFTNSPERLDIVAPGAVITSATLGSGTEQYWGTSQASPAAAGVAALMLECNPALSPAAVKDILERTGVSVTDAKTGRSYPSIRAAEAVEEACTGAGGSSTGGEAGGGGETGVGGNTGSGGSTGVGGDTGIGGGTTGLGGSAGLGGDTGVGGAVTGLGGSAGLGGDTGVGGTITGLGGDTGVGGSTGVGGDTSVGGGATGLGGNTGVGGGITGLGGNTGVGGDNGVGGQIAVGGGSIGLGGDTGVGGAVGLGGAASVVGTTGVGGTTEPNGEDPTAPVQTPANTADDSPTENAGCGCSMPAEGGTRRGALLASMLGLIALRRRRG